MNLKNRFVRILILFGILYGPSVHSDEGEIIPSIAQLEADIDAYQNYFLQRFPGIGISEFNNGVNALPQYTHRKANWSLLNGFPPYEMEMQIAREQWNTAFANDRGFDQCFDDKPPANEYPYYRDGGAHTIAGTINSCLKQHKQDALDLDSAKLARLIAVFREKSNDQPMAVNYSEEGMRAIYRKGQQFYWAKRGQHDFSCASCHVHNAGNSMRGDVLSPGLGQTTGFPVFRKAWAYSKDGGENGGQNYGKANPWGTIHRRYASCMVQAGAAPYAPQSDEYIALEVFQGIMNSGIPINAPSHRQ